MSTQVQTITRSGFREARIHDHVYDPHYTVSGNKDVAARKALEASTQIKREPIYQTMFSDVRPRLKLVAETKNPLPAIMVQQKSAAQPNNAKIEDPQVSGTNRYKYFRRPLISFVNSSNLPAILDAERSNQLLWRAEGPRIGESIKDLSSYKSDPLLAGLERRHLVELSEAVRPLRTIHTQTDYRESEAQTDPYSPEYTVKPGTQPELLTIASLKYGKGLPAGLAEVEMIERMREKREWEAALPPLSDVTQHARRRKLMEEQELREWAYREREIEKLQEEKLEVLIKLMKQQEEQSILRNSQYCDKLWRQKQEEKAGRLEKIDHDYKRSLRKLSGKRNKVEGKLERSSLVEQYGDFGSQAYAPLTRNGVFIDKNSRKYLTQNTLQRSHTEIKQIDRNFPDYNIRQPKQPERKTTTSAGFMRRKYREEKKLDDIYDNIKKKKITKEEKIKPLRFLVKVERPPPRPPTPSVEIPPENQEEIEIAVTVLQAAIRGRRIQNSMHEGMTLRRDLLKELRSTHALYESAQTAVAAQKLETLQHQEMEAQQIQLDTAVSGTLGSLEGETVGETLDFLCKELVRLREERRITEYALLAERVRRIREAEEAGMRQVEERRRREMEEMFRQVTKVEQCVADEYLRTIFTTSVEAVAEEQAKQEIESLAQDINEQAHESEKRRTLLESEELVADLVHSFLLPEAQRQAARDNVKRQQRKYLMAAHEEIFALRGQLSAIEPEIKQDPSQNDLIKESDDNFDQNLKSSRRSSIDSYKQIFLDKEVVPSSISREGSAASGLSLASSQDSNVENHEQKDQEDRGEEIEKHEQDEQHQQDEQHEQDEQLEQDEQHERYQQHEQDEQHEQVEQHEQDEQRDDESENTEKGQELDNKEQNFDTATSARSLSSTGVSRASSKENDKMAASSSPKHENQDDEADESSLLHEEEEEEELEEAQEDDEEREQTQEKENEEEQEEKENEEEQEQESENEEEEDDDVDDEESDVDDVDEEENDD